MSTGSMDSAALVTGASSGIGAELADLVAADGHDVVLTARREERLEDLAGELEATHGVSTMVVPQDLADPSGPTSLYETVQDAAIDVHTLVNNAGVPVYGAFTDTEYESERDMIQVNVVAATELAKLFAPEMVSRGEGAILNTASMASLYPVPKKAVYSATKAYVFSFSRALAHELADDGVTVTVLCPGAVETEYATRGDVEESRTMDGVTNDPRSVAEAAWAGVKDGERIVFPSTFTRYGGQLVRVLPRKKATEIGASTVEDGASWF
jgi:short-subunit dehydrogenase